jgi:phasin family protein
MTSSDETPTVPPVKSAATTRTRAAKAAVKPVLAAESPADVSTHVSTGTVHAAIEAPPEPSPELALPELARPEIATLAVEAPVIAVAQASPSLAPQPIETLVTDMTSSPITGFKAFGNLSAFGKANIDALIKANTAFTKGVEELSKEVLALTQSSLESAAAAGKAVFAAKTVKDIIELNADFTKQSFEKLVANSTKLSEMSVKLATDTFAPISSRVTSAVEKVTKPAA